jgi:hypothetical protein
MRYAIVLSFLLATGCAGSPQETLFGTTTGSLRGPNPTQQIPATLDPAVHWRAKAYLACSLNEAQGLALQPESPEHIAIAATKLCAGKAGDLKEAASATAAPTYVREVENYVRESVVAYVVAIRAESRDPQATQPKEIPIRKAQDV